MNLSDSWEETLQTMESDLKKIIELGESLKLTQEKYLEYVDIFINKQEKIPAVMKELKKLLAVFQNINETFSLKILERLFIQLLGHFNKDVRNEAVILLNMFYDTTTWQEKTPLQTIIKELSANNRIKVTIRKKDFNSSDNSIICICNMPKNFFHKCGHGGNIITWITPTSTEETSNPNLITVIFDLKDYQKCGYYDWNIVKFKEGKFSTVKCVKDIKLEDDLKEAKGRVIVINKAIKDLSIHEVFCDLINADIDKEKGKLSKRGSFTDLESKLDEYSKRYINCLYIMGALERDNNIAYNESTGEVLDIGDSEASPMAVTCRATVSKLLGGDKAFDNLISTAKKYSMSILIDMLTRISSSRFHRKYRNILLNTIDEKGKINICYGTDGHSVEFEDSAMLNYRKVESWDLIVADVINLAGKHKIDGVHLDNCQSWPSIMEIDSDEMFRVDPDGQPAYTSLEILNGEIVIRNEDCGFWGSDLIDQYPNPFLVKLTKAVWKDFPRFIFAGECWSTQKFLNRHVVLSRSGIVPKMYTLPRTLSTVFGRKIHRNGYIESCKPVSVTIFREWINENNQFLPEGAVVIQSSCGQVWPYPALLHGRGNWSAVDLLFALPDVPMTFMEEINGEAYRVQITNVYEQKDMPRAVSTRHPSLKSKSLMKMNFTESTDNDLNKVEQSMNNVSIGNSRSFNNLAISFERTPPKVNSLMSLSGVKIKDVKDMKIKQDMIIKEVGPEFGFDLTKIRFHYDHRRKMRSMHESFRRGKLVFLDVFDANNEPHFHVLAFARHCQEETGIIAINFNSTASSFKLDLKPLLPLFEYEINFNSVCYIEDWVTEEKGDFYFVREVISEGQTRTLTPFSSICFGFQLIPNTKDNFKRTMEKSISRMIGDISSSKYKTLDNYQISIQLKYILEKNLSIEEFAKWFYSTTEKLAKYNLSMYDYFSRIQFFKYNSHLATAFFTYCHTLNKINFTNKNLNASLKNVIESNQLGPIAFSAPELGRWSTVGGLGIMVDELSQGLVKIGQEVIVISPYYERNRKGETGYLKKDPVEFSYIGNIEVTLDQKYTFGVHHGVCNGVKLYFLHNFEIFPSPYAEGSVSFIMKQIALFSKASLELLCFIKTVPAVFLTNDWFGALSAAYAKFGHFGETFRGTTFFHIVHNMEAGYEGRLYPSTNEGTLDHIHKLPTHVLVDPYWKAKVINPSRCALLMSDQWGTVSPSYRKDLMETSPLAPLLRNHSQPFAFPNGIFRAQRLKALEERAGKSHLEAKKALQMKYFNYQDADYSIPLYSFVGRLTLQKGVLLILEAVETLIHRTGGKINIIVGGMGNMKDPYVISCVNKINYLRSRYPHNVWANPTEFFTDGPLVNLGSDFGLMPSLFEPGGIVQHEFFIASTPVIAFKTGGLKDTVIEFDWNSNKGNGILFENHNFHDFVQAVDRSYALFKNQEKYEICRLNAFNSAIDVIDVSKAWCKEYYRLREKVIRL